MSAALQDQPDGRTMQLSMMVTPDEAEIIDRMAKIAGLSISDFLRRQAVPGPNSPGDAEASQVMDELLDGMHRDLRRAADILIAGLDRMESR